MVEGLTTMLQKGKGALILTVFLFLHDPALDKACSTS